MDDIKYLNDGVILNEEQQLLKDAIIAWYKDYQKSNHENTNGRINRHSYFTYSGPAGSGKTTVMRQAIEGLGLDFETDVACAAYVGKAVMVMKMNGLDATTIHSLIYNAGLVSVFDDKRGEYVKKWKFSLKPKAEISKYKLIFCDEATMIPDSIFKDIMSFGVPVIFAGDKNQLPPVMSSSYIMDDPDFVLTKIMRQSEGNPIIWLSQQILQNKYIPYGTYGNSRVMDDIYLGENLLTDYDVILTNTLRLRERLNMYIRKNVIQIKDLNNPHIGEKLICRSNDWSYCIDGFYLVNGMVGSLVDTYPGLKNKYIVMDFFPDVFEMYKDSSDYYDKIFWGVHVDKDYIHADIEKKKEISFTKYVKMEYAYAINVHVAQGSQYNRVLYLDDPFGSSYDMMKKLKYTAITRAIDKIDIVRVKRGDFLYGL